MPRNEGNSGKKTSDLRFFIKKKKKVLIQSLLAGIHLYFLKHLFLYFQLSLIPRQEIILPKMKNAT